MVPWSLNTISQLKRFEKSCQRLVRTPRKLWPCSGILPKKRKPLFVASELNIRGGVRGGCMSLPPRLALGPRTDTGCPAQRNVKQGRKTTGETTSTYSSQLPVRFCNVHTKPPTPLLRLSWQCRCVNASWCVPDSLRNRILTGSTLLF